MKKPLFLLSLVILHFPVLAQQFEWAKTFKSKYGSIPYSMTLDAKGNVYSTGSFRGAADFDPGPDTFMLYTDSTQDYDAFISKLDASGNFVWAKRLGGANDENGYSITIDPSGNIYVAGNADGYSTKTDFDPGMGEYYLPSNGYDDIFILKLDTSGNFVWAKRFGGEKWAGAPLMSLDFKGNIYLSGYFTDKADLDPGMGTYYLTSAGETDIFISKLDPSGNFIWAKQIGGSSYDNGRSIQTDKAGNVYLTGKFEKTVDLDPGAGKYNISTTTEHGGFILKLNTAGNFVWGKQTLDNDGGSITLDSLGNIFMVGSFGGIVDFDFGVNTYYLKGTGAWGDSYILKLDNSSNFEWVKQLSGDVWTGVGPVTFDPSGDIYAAGNFKGTTDFDPGADSAKLIFSDGAQFAYNTFILKLDKSGNFIWVKQLKGKNVLAGRVKLDNYRNIYITGYFSDIADFDPGAGIYNLDAAYQEDVYILKLSQCFTPSAPNTIKGPSHICEDLTLDYTIGKSEGTNDYKWIVPQDVIINSGQNTPSLNVTFGKSSGQITLIVSNKCGSDTIYKQVEVVKQFKADFTANDACETDSVIFLNNSNGAGYTWKFGDGNYSNDDSPKNLYKISGISTTFNVTLVAVVAAGCSDSVTKAVTVNANPISDFNFIINSGNSVDFKASQKNNSLYEWKFGNGDSVKTTSADFSYTYLKTPGNYVVCLKTTNAANCLASTCRNLITTGVARIDKQSGFKIYPNPNPGNFEILIDNPKLDGFISIYDAIGQLVKLIPIHPAQKTYPIELSVSDGIYFVKINLAGYQYVERIVVGR